MTPTEYVETEKKEEQEVTKTDRLLAEFADKVLVQIYTDYSTDPTFNKLLNNFLSLAISSAVAYTIQKTIEFAHEHPEIYEEERE